MAKPYKLWTRAEDDFLRTWKARQTYAWIAEKLGRTERSVHCRAGRLKLPSIAKLREMRRKASIERWNRKDAPLLKEDGFIKAPTPEQLMGRR